MSFDELPPGSVPPSPTGNEQASSAAQETSGLDAPPAAGTRRRRTRTAGTAAAPAAAPAEQDSETPARAGRRPRNVAASLPATEPASEPAEPTAAETPRSDSAPVARPRRATRKREPVVAPEVTANTVEPEPEIAAPAPEPAAPTQSAAPVVPVLPPSRRRRRSLRGAPETDMDSSVSEEIIEPTAVVEPVAELPAPVVATAPLLPPSRRRRSSAARALITQQQPAVEDPFAITPASADEEPAQSEPAPTTVQESAASASAIDRQARRRRSSRGKRGQLLPESPVAESTPAVDAEPAKAAVEGTSDAESEAEAARSRRRRSKRAGGMPVAVAAAAPEIIVAEQPEVVVPLQDVYTVPAGIDVTVGAHLVPRNGMPEIHINGTVYPPVLFFGNVDDPANQERVTSEVKHAASAGVHIHSTLIELPCPLLPESTALAEAAEKLALVAEADPEGYVIPRVVIIPARGWKRRNSAEVSLYADGSNGDPSIGSDLFWAEAAESLKSLVTFLGAQEWGGRVVGYHLERGEWFQPVSQGYDRCTANRDCFREWLKQKYRNNPILLRAAWYDGDIQFSTAEIPQPQGKPAPHRAFYESRRERATVDFNEYTSEITAKRLIALATAVKRAAEHRALVSVCYGYTFEFGHTFSGHLALSLIEQSKAIDLICGPPSYRDRTPGGAASMPAPIDSPALHGKIWISEDDTKTFLAPEAQDPEDFNIRLESREATEFAQQRALGRAISHSSGIGFMDLWGEGWLDDESIWSKLGTFVDRYGRQLALRQHPRVPDVIALIDERSLAHVQRGEAFVRRIASEARNSLQSAGVSFGVYLQNDVLSPTFPDTARLYLFLTPYRLTVEQRAAIKEKLQDKNKTLAWFYAPGCCEERSQIGGAVEESATGVTGIALRPQEWNSEVGSRVVDTHHPLTERLNGREVGAKERLNPSFYVDDPEASVLAEYQGSGLPSIAVKNMGDWKSVFVGDPVLPVDLLRGICRYASVHVWAPQGDDIIDIGCGHVTIHAVRDGNKTIRLPESTGLYSVTDSRHIAEETREYRFFMRRGETHTFCVGNAERFDAFGLPNVQKPAAGTRPAPVVPPPPPEREVRRETPSRPRPQSSDIETLEAVLNMDISALEDVELETLPDEPIDFVFLDPNADPAEIFADGPDAAGEVMAGGRRRRRRGGRGRGRRRQGDGIGPDGTDGPEGSNGGSEPTQSSGWRSGNTTNQESSNGGADTFREGTEGF